MPTPYSDNLYSDMEPVSPGTRPDGDAHAGDDVDDAQALSPSDGYFHNTDSQSDSPVSAHEQHHRQSSTVPYVPNVLVEDPTLQSKTGEQAQAKAAEAERERLLNTGAASSNPAGPPHSSSASPSTSAATPFTPQSSVAYPQLPQSSSTPSHQHRRSVEEDPATQLAEAASSNEPPAGQFATSTRRPRVGYSGQGDAPPAYTPTSPVAGQPNYSTFGSTPAAPTPASSSSMGVPEDQQTLLGGSPDPGKQPVWKRIKDSHDSGHLRKKLKTILGILVLLSILFIIFGSVDLGMSPRRRGRIVDDGPVEKPVLDHGDLEWDPPASMQCLGHPHTFSKQVFKTHFGADRFLGVRQDIEKHSGPSQGRSPHIFGDVTVRASDDSGNQGNIEVEIISSDEKLHANVDFEESGHNQILKVITPRALDWWSSTQRPCMQIRVTVWVPQKAILHSCKVNTVQLNVDIGSGLILGVEEEFEVKTVSGHASAADSTGDTDMAPYNLEAPDFLIETVSGTLRGWFPLYNDLTLTTVSGSINAHIGLKEESLRHDSHPILDVRSVSGTVRVDEDLKRILDSKNMEKEVPVRDYMNRIATTSGSITAELVTASKSTIETISGTTRVRFLPLLDKKWANIGWQPSTKTESQSGSINYELLEPIYADIGEVSDPVRRFPKPQKPDGPNGGDGEASQEEEHRAGLRFKRRKTDDAGDYTTSKDQSLSFFRSVHESISGTMRLNYPASWEGTLKATSISSNIRVHGKGVDVTKRSGLVQKTVEGKKGHGDSRISIEEMSGSVNLLIGEE